MKRSLIIISAIAGALIIAFSCSKELTDKTEPEKVIETNLTDYEKQVNKTIKAFKQKAAYYRENPMLKNGGDTIPADSALWYLEATINYSHAFPNEYYEDMQTEELTLMVPKTGTGEVNMAVLTQKYDELKADITTLYNNSTFEDKGLVLVDMEETGQTADEITMSVEMVSGNKGNDPGPGPFVEGDDWWYGEDEGKCYLPVYESDASNELEQAMNNYIGEQNAGLFFVHPTIRFKKGGDGNTLRLDDPEPFNNVYDYYLYSASTEYGTVTDDILCLEYVEMNVYYDYLKYLLYTKIPDEDLPPGYTIEKIEWIIGDNETVNTDDTHYFHYGKFRFGYPIGYGEGDGPEEL